MSKDIERRAFAVDKVRIEKRDGETGARLIGHAAVFNQRSEDLGGFCEQIAPGCFAETIEADDIRALFNHDPNLVLGRNRAKTLTLAEDDRGLAIDILLPDTHAAADLAVSIERGDVAHMSFGFMVKPNGQDWAQDDGGRTIRTLKKVRLFDVSPVTFPAYPQTDIAVRALQTWRAAQAPKADPLARMRMRTQLAAAG